MTDSPSDQSRRATFGFTLLLAMLLLLIGSKTILYDTLDPDCFWHLRVAEQLERDGIHPIVDDLSFSSTKQPWTPYSWLAELAMKFVWDAGGYRAAIAAQALVIAGIFFFIALTCLEMSGPPKPYVGIGAAVTFAAYLALPYLSFRPVTLALLFIAISAWILVRDRRMNENSPAIVTIPLLTALLINLHPFALFVPMWTGALLIGAVVERRRGAHWSELGENNRRVKRYGILCGATTLACLCTPMLGGMIRTIFHYGGHDPMVAAAMIAELKPFYAGPMGAITAIILLLSIGAMIWQRKQFRVAEWIVLAVGLLALLRMGRLAPLFVLIAAPMLAASLPMLRGRLLARPIVWGMFAIVIALNAARIIDEFPHSDVPLAKWLNRHGPETPGYPTGAADFVAEHIAPVNGRLINDFSWGGYLEWKLGPKFQTFMDARTQLFSPEFWNTTCLADQKTMVTSMSAVRADAAIVPIKSPMMSDALRALNWREVYRDDRAFVLIPPGNPSTVNAR